MSENDENISHENDGFRCDQIPHLPESVKGRRQLGQDLQPVGDYAGIAPYYRVCEDVGDVQHQEQSEPEAFTFGDWWWDHRQIRFLNGKAFLGLSALILFIPYVWGTILVGGGGVLSLYLVDLIEMPRLLKVLWFLVVGFGWIAASFFLLIKTMPWVMGAFTLLLRPFDKLLAKLLDRGLEAGESFFSRETGELSFAVSGGKKLTAPFEEFDT